MSEKAATRVTFACNKIYATLNGTLVYMAVSDHHTATAEWQEIKITFDQKRCCPPNEHKVQVMCLCGEHVLDIQGPSGSGGEGQLCDSLICDTDSDMSVLIADRTNNQLQVMTRDGQFKVVDLPATVRKPRSAVFVNNCLYVTEWNNRRLVLIKYA